MQSDPTDKIPSISSNQLPDPAHGNGLPQEKFFEGSDARPTPNSKPNARNVGAKSSYVVA